MRKNVLCAAAVMLVAMCGGRAALSAAEFPAFKAQQLDEKLTVGYGVLLMDVNGDKKPDIVVADSHRVIWFENPTWKMHTILQAQTAHDNVAIAPIDINGDGRVDLVLGAGWQGYNTSENSTLQWLEHPASSEENWTLHSIPFDEVSLHRVRVARIEGQPRIIAAPLMGRGASGANNWSESTSSILEYAIPKDPAREPWEPKVITNQFHVVHNFTPVDWEGDGKTSLLIACYEGLWLLQTEADGKWKATQIGSGEQANPNKSRGCSEVKLGRTRGGGKFIATIEPWHGNEVVVYMPPKSGQGLWDRKVLDTSLNEGHGIWLADLERNGGDDIIACSRGGKPGVGRGVFVYSMDDSAGAERRWTRHVIDDQEMAAEDLAAADLNGDGNIDIVAVGRATHNVRIYWNPGAK